MKVKYHMIERMSLDAFAKQHGLVMQVHERSNSELSHAWADKFFCYFAYLEELDGIVLHATAGNGKTPKDAITNYCYEISNKLMVYKATSKKLRKEINVPKILPDWEEERIK